MREGADVSDPQLVRLMQRNAQLEKENAKLRTGLPPLSKREAQVYKMLANGFTVSEIADTIFLSVKTVSTYRTRVLDKFELRNNAEITKHAIRNRVIEVELLPAELCVKVE